MARAIDSPDNKVQNGSARTNALLELVSDQLMYASLVTPGVGSELMARLGQDGQSAFVTLAARIVQSRKILGLEP